MSPEARLAKKLVADAALNLGPGKWERAVRTAFLVRRMVKCEGVQSQISVSKRDPKLSRDWINLRHAYCDLCWFLSPCSIPWIEAAGFDYDDLLKEMRGRNMLPPEGTVFS